MAMASETLLELVRCELGRHPMTGLPLEQLRLTCRDGLLFLAGDVDTLATKRVVLARAASVHGIQAIVDELGVRPRLPMTDAELEAFLLASYRHAPMFAGYTIANGNEVQGGSPAISLSVRNSVVGLRGAARTLAEKRMAAVVAWWSPGRRDVRNGLAVLAPCHENDDCLAADLRMVLASDAELAGARILARVSRGRASLTGIATHDAQCTRAEEDAWCLDGIEQVDNAIAVSRSGLNLG